jgi:CrcB protein
VSLRWVLAVGAGGALGACARYAAGTLLRSAGRDTLAVNVAGSFLLGAVAAAGVDGAAAFALGTGFCGALTTFSSFSVHTVERGCEGGDCAGALLYAFGTLAAALLAVVAGAAAGSLL